MEPTIDIRRPPPEAFCYRIHRRYFLLGCACAVCFISFGIASTAVAYFNIDGSFRRPKLAALIFCIFWGACTLLSVFLIVAYFREKLVLTPLAIAYRGVLRKKLIESDSVACIKWRTWPAGGSLVVQGRFRRITVHLSNFKEDQQVEIIQYFRRCFRTEIQENWLRFENLRRGSSLPISPQANQMLRYAFLAGAIILLFFAILLGYCSYTGLGMNYLASAIVNVLGAFFIFWYLNRPVAKAGVESRSDR
jgi:hypothetical protein